MSKKKIKQFGIRKYRKTVQTHFLEIFAAVLLLLGIGGQIALFLTFPTEAAFPDLFLFILLPLFSLMLLGFLLLLFASQRPKEEYWEPIEVKEMEASK